MRKSMASRAREEKKSGSCTNYLLDLRPSTSYLSNLFFSFLIYELGKIMKSISYSYCEN